MKRYLYDGTSRKLQQGYENRIIYIPFGHGKIALSEPALLSGPAHKFRPSII